jgi:hypothetical protein
MPTNAQSLFEVSSLGFNTRSKEMAPAFFGNGLVFVSDRRNDFITTYVDEQLNPLSNIYFAGKKSNGKFNTPNLLSKELTTFMFEGPATFSKDGKQVYFTRSIDINSSNKNRGRQDTTFGIFSAHITNDSWSSITPFKFNSAAYNTGYPFLSADGLQLFFCSDAPGGFGGFDIYVSVLNGNSWSDPVNLGPQINTAQNEVFPFYLGGKLYFASRGHKQQKDLDIYFSTLYKDEWQNPVALQEPFNTLNDDYGLIFNAASDTAYFVSDRNGSPDIFGAYSSLPTFAECVAQKENDYCFVFYDSNSDLDTTLYAYEWDMGDGTAIRALEAEHCFARPDTYLVQLNVIDKLTNEIMISQATYSFVVEKIEQPYILASDTVVAGQPCDFTARESFFKSFNGLKYYWDFGDGSRAEGIDAKHAFVLAGTYQIKLGVKGDSEDSTYGDVPLCVTRSIVVLKAIN